MQYVAENDVVLCPTCRSHRCPAVVGDNFIATRSPSDILQNSIHYQVAIRIEK